MDTFYITTPIYYVNAKPHLGHAYTTIVADVMKRFESMKDKETFFLTGTDEHGDKIERAAKVQNMTPKRYADKISAMFKNLWPNLSISNDAFIRTTDPFHIETVKKILQKIYDSGDIYFSEYEGLYCFGCERFYTERELAEGKCPDHQKEPEKLRESNYFFKMSKYQDWLIDHIKNNPDFIRPKRYKNEVLSFLKEPLEDLCISRPKTRLEWGITLPFDEKYVTYVWFDALINYISALGYPDGEKFVKFWPNVQHIVAKDILKPHGIYWPIMLKAANIPVYRHLNVHGYWNVESGKMSKSLGNAVEPLDLKNVYGLDAFRFFLMRDMVFGLDSDFSEKAIVARINAELANDLGNLFSRTSAMLKKYCKSTVPDTKAFTHKSEAIAMIDEYIKNMDSLNFHTAIGSVWGFISLMNKYIDEKKPWELAKKEEDRPQLETVLCDLLTGLSIVAALIYPVMPAKSEEMFKGLGINRNEDLYKFNNIIKFEFIKQGTEIYQTAPLFPRIEIDEVPQKSEKAKLEKDDKFITIEDFSKIELKVATVISAKPVKGADKLIELTVEADRKRTIVAGIAKTYTPSQLIGKQIIIVANLKPAKLRGVVSEGMLLAASSSTDVSIATVEKEIDPGTRLK